MADQIVLAPLKSSSLRRTRSSSSAAWADNWLQAKGEWHAIQGYNSSLTQQFRTLMQFGMTAGFFPGVQQITSAYLHLFTASDHSGLHPQTLTNPATKNVVVGVKKIAWSEAGGGEGVWTGALANGGAEWFPTHQVAFNALSQDGHESVVNVTSLVTYMAPSTIYGPDGKTKCSGGGTGKVNFGLVIAPYGTATYESVFASAHHGNVAIQPFLVVNVVLKGGPGETTTDSPNGNIPRGTPQFFRGIYLPGAPADNIAGVTIVRHQTGKADWTEPEWTPDANAVTTSTFEVPVPVSWPSATPFTWGAKVRNNKGGVTPLSAPLAVQWMGTPPDLTAPQPSGTTLDQMLSAQFQVGVHVPATVYRATQWRIQLRSRTVPTDPNWESSVLWDSGLVTVPLSADEAKPAPTGGVNQNLSMAYGGPALAANDYSWRVQALDPYGATSPWLYSDFTLATGYDELEPPPGVGVNLTGYGKSPPFRIRIFGMGALRGPGKLLAELTDASNVGASEFYNSPGEFYFTLPVTHPQISVIEPYQCHYALELHTEKGWEGKAFGLITDFDANEDQAVFYGTDYLGVLDRLMDERFDPTNADLPTDKGGAKYNSTAISTIIIDQLTKAKAGPNSPVGFITVGAVPSIAEKVTIYASFKQRLTFISGLIESAKAGTGRKTRILCVRNSNGTFTWRVMYDPGIQRDNIRLEWGGMINGFRTVPFSNWGTSVSAIGRTALGTKVYSAVAAAPGVDETRYGHWPSIVTYADVDDINDVRRRATQQAAKVSRVGKQMGLGLRVKSLGLKDGWEVCDSVPVLIQRGVVDTQRMGGVIDPVHPELSKPGYWTIWGWTWNSFPDGHSNLTLSILPREDTIPVNPDLIPSKPIFSSTEWQVGYGVPDTWGVPPVPTPPPGGLRRIEDIDNAVAPTTALPLSDENVIGEHYQDLNTGCIYELNQDFDDPGYGTYTEVYCPDTGSDVPPYVPDTTAPGIPVIKSATSDIDLLEDGTSMVGITAVVGYDATHLPGGDNDLGQIVMQSTKFEMSGPVSGLPDWSRASEWTTEIDDETGATDISVRRPSVQALTPFWLRAAARDRSGNLSGWSSPPYQITTGADPDGPSPPQHIVTVPGNKVFAVRWDAINAPDLAYVEVQWKKAADTDFVSILRAAGTLLVVTEVENGATYNVRVRSVDTSGNVQTGAFDTDGSPISGKVDDPTIGWVAAPNVTPSGVAGSDVIFTSADIENIFAGEINADWITSGTLRVGNAPPLSDPPPEPSDDVSIEVYNVAGNLVGRWSAAAGIEVLESNPDINYVLQITESGLTIKDLSDPANPVTVVTLSPLGIDAASITFGTARGGHNLILNSSFEMGSFVASTNIPNQWDVTADFNATRLGTDTNISVVGGTTLQMTSVT